MAAAGEQRRPIWIALQAQKCARPTRTTAQQPTQVLPLWSCGRQPERRRKLSGQNMVMDFPAALAKNITIFSSRSEQTANSLPRVCLPPAHT